MTALLAISLASLAIPLQAFCALHLPLRSSRNTGCMTSHRWQMALMGKDLLAALQKEVEEMRLSSQGCDLYFVKFLEKEKEMAVMAKEKEMEMAVMAKEMKLEQQIASIKEKARKMGQQAVYEKFLSACWCMLQQLDQEVIMQIRALEKTFPKEPTKVQKSLIDRTMRLDIVQVKDIFQKIMQECNSNPECQLPRPHEDCLYGILSTSVHLLLDDLYVRDDEPQDRLDFFECLVQMYRVRYEVLETDAIEAFDAVMETEQLTD